MMFLHERQNKLLSGIEHSCAMSEQQMNLQEEKSEIDLVRGKPIETCWQIA